MRTIRTKVYQFNELNDEAKQVAIEKYRNNNDDLFMDMFKEDCLRQIEDVQSKFECTNDEAYGVLEGALNNDATMEQIWFAIDFHGESDNLISK